MCSRKYSRKNNQKIIYKRGKTVFVKNDGCRKKFVRLQEETAIGLLYRTFTNPVQKLSFSVHLP